MELANVDMGLRSPSLSSASGRTRKACGMSQSEPKGLRTRVEAMV